jgi:hypothetical protein
MVGEDRVNQPYDRVREALTGSAANHWRRIWVGPRRLSCRMQERSRRRQGRRGHSRPYRAAASADRRGSTPLLPLWLVKKLVGPHANPAYLVDSAPRQRHPCDRPARGDETEGAQLKRFALAALAALLAPLLLAAPAHAVDCSTEYRIFLQASTVGGGNQAQVYNYDRHPACSDANTAFMKFDSGYTTYAETGLYQTSGGTYTAFYEYRVYPGSVQFVLRGTLSTKNVYNWYALSLASGTYYNVRLDTGSGYFSWAATANMGYTYGRPESEISRYGSDDSSGYYSLMQYKRTTDGVWVPWSSIACDMNQSNMPDWRAHATASDSWTSEHIAPSAGSCT